MMACSFSSDTMTDVRNEDLNMLIKRSFARTSSFFCSSPVVFVLPDIPYLEIKQYTFVLHFVLLIILLFLLFKSQSIYFFHKLKLWINIKQVFNYRIFLYISSVIYFTKCIISLYRYQEVA